jgi:hypothetical protein
MILEIEINFQDVENVVLYSTSKLFANAEVSDGFNLAYT